MPARSHLGTSGCDRDLQPEGLVELQNNFRGAVHTSARHAMARPLGEVMQYGMKGGAYFFLSDPKCCSELENACEACGRRSLRQH